MSLLLLILLPCVCKGFSVTKYSVGETYSINLHKVHIVKFIPSNDPLDEKTLWTRYSPGFTDDPAWTVRGSRLVKKLVQSDSGRYTSKDGSQFTVSMVDIKVVAETKSLYLQTGQSFNFEANLEPLSCNIFFTPEENNEEILIVHEGKTKYEFYNSPCQSLDFSKPCRLSNYNVHSPCRGLFVIRDKHGDSAMEVIVEMDEEDDVPVFFIILGFVVFVIVVLCCVVRCCFSRESTRKNTPQPAASPGPALNYPEYDREPARLTSEQPNEPTRNRAVPQSSVTNPLIHCPLPLDDPPSYSEVCPRFRESQTPPPPFQPEPRFEVRGANFDLSPPLHSDAPQTDVYNSDKFNFL